MRGPAFQLKSSESSIPKEVQNSTLAIHRERQSFDLACPQCSFV